MTQKVIQTQTGMSGNHRKRSWVMDEAMEKIIRKATACENEFKSND